jgi:hypothetical protein
MAMGGLVSTFEPLPIEKAIHLQVNAHLSSSDYKLVTSTYNDHAEEQMAAAGIT